MEAPTGNAGIEVPSVQCHAEFLSCFSRLRRKVLREKTLAWIGTWAGSRGQLSRTEPGITAVSVALLTNLAASSAEKWLIHSTPRLSRIKPSPEVMSSAVNRTERHPRGCDYIYGTSLLQPGGMSTRKTTRNAAKASPFVLFATYHNPHPNPSTRLRPECEASCHSPVPSSLF